MNFSAGDVLNFIVALGWVKGVFAIFFFMAHYWVYSLYKARIDDRQKEIDRIAAENKEYRERFLHIMDSNFKHQSPKKKK